MRLSYKTSPKEAEKEKKEEGLFPGGLFVSICVVPAPVLLSNSHEQSRFLICGVLQRSYRAIHPTITIVIRRKLRQGFAE
jgi:hypothetical protein